jgi:predicted DNA-binding transcriptional regulator AlpA
MSTEVKKRVLNTKEAAAYLGIISHRTLEDWRKQSTPKGPRWVDLDGKIGYRVVDLDEYLEDRICEPGDDFAA